MIADHLISVGSEKIDGANKRVKMTKLKSKIEALLAVLSDSDNPSIFCDVKKIESKVDVYNENVNNFFHYNDFFQEIEKEIEGRSC